MSLTEPPKVPRSETQVPVLEEPPRPRMREPRPHVPVHPLLWALTIVIVLAEVVQHLEAAGLLPEIFSRVSMMLMFAFFDLEWEQAMAGYGVTPHLVWSLVTHAFLHAGWLHLFMNMAAFLALGHAIVQGIGFGRFFATFVICAVAGAVTLGLLSDIVGPLVGASGAVFGFLGMVTAWQERMLARRGLSRRSIWQRILGLIAINALLAFALGGLLAWEAHLGGFVAGWILGLIWPPGSVRLPF